MNEKTCKNCGTKVEISTKYCQNCGGSEFITGNPPAVPKGKPSLVHKLFYWDYDGYYVLSKSKLMGFGVFLITLSIATPSLLPGVIIVGLIFGLIVFLIGYIIHMFLSHPSKAKITHNDYGFIRDFINLLFYWQNKNTGEYVLSKTKIISHIIFVLFVILSVVLKSPSLFASILLGLIFEVPAFLIGSGLHKLTNPNPVNPPKQVSKPKEIPKSKPVIENKQNNIVPEYLKYKIKIEELKKQYTLKEKQTRDLIEKRFTPPQLTYTRFISVVDKSTDLFTKQSGSALTMIDIATEYSAKIDSEIQSKITILTDIIDKLDDLTNELVITMDDSDDEEINNLFDDMSDLIKSVKDYE